MDYLKIYNEIIESSIGREAQGYTERHHIKPRCIGGDDSSSNIAILTAREHYLAHWLLCKIHDSRKLVFAWNMMCNTKGGNRYNSHTFAYARKAWSETMSEMNRGVKFSDERKARLSDAHKGQVAWNKGLKTGRTGAFISSRKEYLLDPKLCKICSKMIKYEMRARRTYCSNLCAHSDPENPVKLAEVVRKKNSGSFKSGGVVSNETASKISSSMTGLKRPRGFCPHCNKEGAISLLKRWHYNNCKELKECL